MTRNWNSGDILEGQGQNCVVILEYLMPKMQIIGIIGQSICTLRYMYIMEEPRLTI